MTAHADALLWLPLHEHYGETERVRVRARRLVRRDPLERRYYHQLQQLVFGSASRVSADSCLQ